MLNAAFAAVILLMQAAPAATPAPAAAAAATPATSVSPLTVQGQKKSVIEDTKIVCRREKVLGSMFPKEVCSSKQQLTERRNEDQAQLRSETWNRPYQVH
jgi:invasion protein IalB